MAILDALSLPLASALANAVRIGEAERLSQTDDLTKLHNADTCASFCLTRSGERAVMVRVSRRCSSILMTLNE